MKHCITVTYYNQFSNKTLFYPHKRKNNFNRKSNLFLIINFRIRTPQVPSPRIGMYSPLLSKTLGTFDAITLFSIKLL